MNQVANQSQNNELDLIRKIMRVQGVDQFRLSAKPLRVPQSIPEVLEDLSQGRQVDKAVAVTMDVILRGRRRIFSYSRNRLNFLIAESSLITEKFPIKKGRDAAYRGVLAELDQEKGILRFIKGPRRTDPMLAIVVHEYLKSVTDAPDASLVQSICYESGIKDPTFIERLARYVEEGYTDSEIQELRATVNQDIRVTGLQVGRDLVRDLPRDLLRLYGSDYNLPYIESVIKDVTCALAVYRDKGTLDHDCFEIHPDELVNPIIEAFGVTVINTGEVATVADLGLPRSELRFS